MNSEEGNPSIPPMKTNANLGLALLATLVVGGALAPSNAQAQFWHPRHRAVYGADWTVRPLVDTTERQSNAFRDFFEHHVSDGRMGRYHDNQYLKHQIQLMDESFERLRDKADDHRPGIGVGDLQDALKHARMVDREIYFAGDNNRTIREWSDLRYSLNSLASLYQVRGL